MVFHRCRAGQKVGQKVGQKLGQKLGQIIGLIIGIALCSGSARAVQAQGVSGLDAQTAASPASASPPGPDSPELLARRLQAALDILREKGLLNDREYEAALQRRQSLAATPPFPAPLPPAAPPAAPPGASPAAVLSSKFEMSLYGFIELDGIYDSTQSYNELAGNTLLARPETFAGEHGRTLFTMRNSRLGFKARTPQWRKVSLHGTFEFDLLGNQPPTATELQTFVNDTFRVRHAFVELRSSWVNLLVGQGWQLFGWQSFFHPATVAIQGLPGQIYSRAPQLRLSHVFAAGAVQIETAIAAARAPQRDSAVPDGQFGVRLSTDRWTGVHSVGSTSTAVDGAALGFSGALRYFTLAVPTAAPPADAATNGALGWGVSIDAVLPIIPARERRAGALTINGSFVRGTGIADFYTGLTGGVAFPAAPPLAKGFSPGFVDIDNGVALYTKDLKLETVGWQSFLVGLQLYLPPQGKLWLASNFSQLDASNSTDFAAGTTSGVLVRSRWADVNLFADVLPGLRLGAEYSWFWQQYDDQGEAHNHRFQVSAFYIF